MNDIYYSIMADVTDRFKKELMAKKNDVIKSRFTEKGFGHLLIDIEGKRFKRVVVEQYPDCEKWYADNGTDEGILVITFLKPKEELVLSEDGTTIKLITEIKYI